MEMVLSTLPKTWILDLDGTILRHNGYLTEEGDEVLPGVRRFLDALPEEDRIVIMTARDESARAETEAFLRDNGIRYDAALFGLPVGERILVNDKKPSGLDMSVAVNLERNVFEMPRILREK